MVTEVKKSNQPGLKLYVEGGGDSNALRTKCRQGFTSFLTKAGLAGSMPRVVACGGRKAAYDDFCTAVENGEPAFLLVDSEELVDETNSDKSWAHLAAREGNKWPTPDGAEDRHCHLMVVCMESWFLADRNQMSLFFGHGFQESALPSVHKPLETVSKKSIFDSLKNATRNCKTKAVYGKGEHSFDLLALIDPQKVMGSSPWAKRFISELKGDDHAQAE